MPNTSAVTVGELEIGDHFALGGTGIIWEVTGGDSVTVNVVNAAQPEVHNAWSADEIPAEVPAYKVSVPPLNPPDPDYVDLGPEPTGEFGEDVVYDTHVSDLKAGMVFEGDDGEVYTALEVDDSKLTVVEKGSVVPGAWDWDEVPFAYVHVISRPDAPGQYSEHDAQLVKALKDAQDAGDAASYDQIESTIFDKLEPDVEGDEDDLGDAFVQYVGDVAEQFGSARSIRAPPSRRPGCRTRSGRPATSRRGRTTSSRCRRRWSATGSCRR